MLPLSWLAQSVVIVVIGVIVLIILLLIGLLFEILYYHDQEAQGVRKCLTHFQQQRYTEHDLDAMSDMAGAGSQIAQQRTLLPTFIFTILASLAVSWRSVPFTYRFIFVGFCVLLGLTLFTALMQMNADLVLQRAVKEHHRRIAALRRNIKTHEAECLMALLTQPYSTNGCTMCKGEPTQHKR